MERHETIRIAVIGFFVTVVLTAMIGGMVYTGHQNNIKDKKFATVCMEHGGEYRTNSNGTVTCDK